MKALFNNRFRVVPKYINLRRFLNFNNLINR